MRHSQKIRERIIRGDTVHLDVPEFAGEDNDLDQRQIFLPKDDLILTKTIFLIACATHYHRNRDQLIRTKFHEIFEDP